jgi:hypothetical protein
VSGDRHPSSPQHERERGARRDPTTIAIDAETLARRFHETYERLAPAFGYVTRPATAVAWEQMPEQNRRLMLAVCQELLTELFGSPNARGEQESSASEP